MTHQEGRDDFNSINRMDRLERVRRNACFAQDFVALLRGSCSKPVCLAGNFRDGQLEGAGTVTMPNGSVTVGACIYA
jgi:hypothetical protein